MSALHWAPLLDRILLFQLHRKRSNVSQFTQLPSQTIDVSELHTFYSTPGIPSIEFEYQGSAGNYKLGRFSFESGIPLGQQKNDICSGLYYENQVVESMEHVIFVHGWRMDRLDRIKDLLLDGFMNREANLYFYTLPYHLDRTPESSAYGGELMVSSNIERTLLAVRQAIHDLRALIRWIKNFRKGPVVLIGISLGGLFTNLASIVENQIDLLISIMYANRLSYSVWKTIPGIYIRKDLIEQGITFEQLDKYWAITDPSRFQPVVPKEKILLISGQYDRYVLEEDTALLWESWGKPKRIVYPCGHAGIALNKRKISEDVFSFVASKLGQ